MPSQSPSSPKPTTPTQTPATHASHPKQPSSPAPASPSDTLTPPSSNHPNESQSQYPNSDHQPPSSESTTAQTQDVPFQQPSPQQVLEALSHVFHQTHVSYDGAAASLNAVLQGPYFDDQSLADLTGGGPNDAFCVNLALRAFNLSLSPFTIQPGTTPPPITVSAVLCNQDGRWFALRRIGKHWMNLNDGIGRPAQVLEWQLALSLRQLIEDGCLAFFVQGTLPDCEADQCVLWRTEFVWGVCGGVICEGDDEEDEEIDEECIGDMEDEWLQLGIQRSLEDVGVGRPLRIRTAGLNGTGK